jgi:NAD(P)-dependent dehydrogenase (short-subunit alcohol dehydrogenase family)
MKRRVAFFGGTSGLGKLVQPYLSNFDLDIVSSKNVNLIDDKEISSYFKSNANTDILILFNNFNHNSFLHKYESENDLNLTNQISINITGITKCIIECLKLMRPKKYGRIILATSITAEIPVYGTSIYSACKSFQESIIKNIALENASLGITANCIQLGYMDGGLTYTLDQELRNQVISKIPARRFGSPDEIAKTIEFLINNEYINGTVIKLNGGM